MKIRIEGPSIPQFDVQKYTTLYRMKNSLFISYYKYIERCFLLGEQKHLRCDDPTPVSPSGPTPPSGFSIMQCYISQIIMSFIINFETTYLLKASCLYLVI